MSSTQLRELRGIIARMVELKQQTDAVDTGACTLLSPRQRWHLCWRRLAGFIYDLMPVMALVMVVAGLVLALRGGEPVPVGALWHQALLLVTLLAFYVVSWRRLGQTLGMRAWRIRCCRYDGSPLGLHGALLRAVLGVVLFAALSLGGYWLFSASGEQRGLRLLAAALLLGASVLSWLWQLLDPYGRSVQDRLSGSVVTRLPPRK